MWDLETGRAVRTLEGHTHWVRGVAVTGDGKRAVCASQDTTLRVWGVATVALCARCGRVAKFTFEIAAGAQLAVSQAGGAPAVRQ